MLTAATALLLLPSGASASLGEPWGYEKVTPGGKGPGNVSGTYSFQASRDGDAFLWTARTPFASIKTEGVLQLIRYVSRRGPDGWTSMGVDAPFAVANFVSSGLGQNTLRSDPDLNYAIVSSPQELTPDAEPGTLKLYQRNLRTGDLRLIMQSAALMPNNITEWAAAGPFGVVPWMDPAGQSILINGTRLDPTLIGGRRWTPEGLEPILASDPAYPTYTELELRPNHQINDTRHAQATVGGAERYYYSLRPPSGSGQTWPIYGQQVGDTEFRSVSRSRVGTGDGPSLPGQVLSVDADGSHLVFASTSRLLDDIPTHSQRGTAFGGTTNHLYRYSWDDDSIEYMASIRGNDLGLRQLSDDGQTAIIVSTYALTPDGIEGGVGANLAANTYAWRDGQLNLVASHEPRARGGATDTPVRTLSNNGRFYAFADNDRDRAASFGVANESPACMQGTQGLAACSLIYVYDALNETLECASCLPHIGVRNADDGDALLYSHLMNGHSPQYIADDGTVYFTSVVGYDPQDANSLRDVYAFRAGEIELVSGGKPGMESRFLDATGDGKRVFFATTERISAADTDDEWDIYRAERGIAGDPRQATQIGECEGSACRGPVADSPSGPVIGSVGLGGDGNVQSSAPKGSMRIQRLKAGAGAVARIRVRVPAAGRVVLSGSQVRRSATTTRRGGTVTLRVALKPAARKRLQKRKRLRTGLRIAYRAQAGEATVKQIKVVFRSPRAQQRSKANKGER